MERTWNSNTCGGHAVYAYIRGTCKLTYMYAQLHAKRARARKTNSIWILHLLIQANVAFVLRDWIYRVVYVCRKFIVCITSTHNKWLKSKRTCFQSSINTRNHTSFACSTLIYSINRRNRPSDNEFIWIGCGAIKQLLGIFSFLSSVFLISSSFFDKYSNSFAEQTIKWTIPCDCQRLAGSIAHSISNIGNVVCRQTEWKTKKNFFFHLQTWIYSLWIFHFSILQKKIEDERGQKNSVEACYFWCCCLLSERNEFFNDF